MCFALDEGILTEQVLTDVQPRWQIVCMYLFGKRDSALSLVDANHCMQDK